MGYADFFLFFMFYSFLGWVLETIFATVKHKRFINRGFLYGFFCPIYGFGAILVLLSSEWVTRVFEHNLTALGISILLAITLVTVVEYLTGFILEKIFNCKWWDYSDNFANIHGYISFNFSLLWGLLAFLLIQVVHPVVSEVILSISVSVRGYIALLLFLYFLADTAKTVIDALDLRKVILNYANLPDNKYYEKILRYKRFFMAFPRLLVLNAGIINRDVRSILNDRFDQIKSDFKNKFQ